MILGWKGLVVAIEVALRSLHLIAIFSARLSGISKSELYVKDESIC